MRGKIECFDKDFKLMKKGFEIFFLKLVVDFDEYVVFRKDVKV